MAAQMERRSAMADFTIVQQLGSGSYGKVYKVQRKADNQFYAIKEVNIRKLQPREREDAVNEIRILASIHHKNIVRYCDAFTEKDNLYIVMEFAEHGDISTQIEKFKKANKYIKEESVWSYLIQIAQSLDAMHSRNVLHRDIKPKNVFLTGKNHVRLGDLGCAKLMKSGMARTQIGTPYYMSPEIWANKPYDVKSDVWALGCLVYELAQLSPPFLANDMNGLAAKVKNTAAPRISKHYSEDMANLVALMLAKDPRSRPDMKAVLAMPSVQARMTTVPANDEGAWAGEEMRQHMLATIRVPMGFGYGAVKVGGPGGLNLPAPSFPQQRPATSPSKAEGVAAAAALAEGKKEEARPSTAAVPSAPQVIARANFAAITSPPHLGRPAPAEKENAFIAKPAAAPVAAVAAVKRPLSAAPGVGNAYAAAYGGVGAFAKQAPVAYKPAAIAYAQQAARISAPVPVIAAAAAKGPIAAPNYRPVMGGAAALAAPNGGIRPAPLALAPARYPVVPAYNAARPAIAFAGAGQARVGAGGAAARLW